MRQRIKFALLGLASGLTLLQVSACFARFLGDFVGDSIILGAV